ncbi:MAG: hypothetical protein KJ077_04990 [Anaerolineae bacterium]|nr:hypothetical protein [Anaerolineae bacterium]
MQFVTSKSKFRQWLKPSRLIPLLTILGAGVALILSLLGLINLSVAENIVIALLGLLAIDALSERLSLLERIEKKLSNLSVEQTLRTRNDIPSLEEQAGYASEICILAVSGITLVRHIAFFESKLRDGCKIRIVLLDPDGPSLQTWKRLDSRVPNTESEITTTLQYFKQLIQVNKAKGRCEIRLLDVFLPFSMFATDISKETGTILLAYHVYQSAPGERPHVYLTLQDSSYWYDFYRRQFEQAWSNAAIWTP